MSEYGLPALYALFVWWFSTGAVIYLDGLPRHTFRWSMLGATILLGVSIYGMWEVRDDMSVMGAYLGFTFGLLAWAWLEVSFYTGYVTGPRKERCPEGCRGWPHFVHAIQASLHHELAVLGSAAVVIWVSWGAENQIGMWTFIVLWWMHQSARLNVFLGVRNLNEEFLPEHLAFLKGFLTKKPMNLLFPVSVTVSTVFAVFLFNEAFAASASAFEAVGFTFLGTLLVLAILEHWFLVLPLSAMDLWRWSMRSHKTPKSFDVEIAAGFLGAGKTTFLRRRLAEIDPDVRTVALVNDFSELGVDASLLGGRGAEVVELPNGCICCSLRNDLADQLKDVVSRWSPQHVVIEPSGVADVADLMRVLKDSDAGEVVGDWRIFTVIDASTFVRDYTRMPAYFEHQASLDPVFIVNKVDLVGHAELDTVIATLRDLNPSAQIACASYGAVTAWNMPASSAAGLSVVARHAAADQAGGQAHGHGAFDLQSWSTRLSGLCDPDGLRSLLDSLAAGSFGDIERVKGIARSGAGWVHFDVAGGRSRIAAFSPGKHEQARVVAIGRELDEGRLTTAFQDCTIPATG